MTILTVSSKGRIVIPAEIRKKYNLRAGAPVVLVDYGGVISIVPAMSDPIEESAGQFKGGSSLTAALRAERKHERARGR